MWYQDPVVDICEVAQRISPSYTALHEEKETKKTQSEIHGNHFLNVFKRPPALHVDTHALWHRTIQQRESQKRNKISQKPGTARANDTTLPYMHSPASRTHVRIRNACFSVVILFACCYYPQSKERTCSNASSVSDSSCDPDGMHAGYTSPPAVEDSVADTQKTERDLVLINNIAGKAKRPCRLFRSVQSRTANLAIRRDVTVDYLTLTAILWTILSATYDLLSSAQCARVSTSLKSVERTHFADDLYQRQECSLLKKTINIIKSHVKLAWDGSKLVAQCELVIVIVFIKPSSPTAMIQHECPRILQLAHKRLCPSFGRPSPSFSSVVAGLGPLPPGGLWSKAVKLRFPTTVTPGSYL
ncbi:uncharacterized protein CLUP02_10574 [Colletotrichum lupini]|uniref:Uncharacterized protein n=1 Tax=Colletotrichum lupini TaxID=145971 RepID=A0A9Q8SX14_9PEZI|nr:uncharacterized protein CLUP02_10574 [Colletotrichum lupini]UQC85078.1 hypothetical protein CLUP02_10574 [Colletotrichum lupini]